MLRDAQRDPGLLPTFYQRLLDSEVIVPVQARPDQIGRSTIPAGALLDVITMVRSDGIGVIPFFTSPARLFQWSPEGERCVLMRVRELFESRPDMLFHLNPGSPDGQAFRQAEMHALLSR